MVGLLQYSSFIPGPASRALEVLSGDPDGWLGGTAVDGASRLLSLRPDGLLADPAASIDVLVSVGPATRTAGGLLQRLSFRVPDATPEVRCDLEVRTARAEGCRIRLRGDWRPPLHATGDDDVAEVVEAVARPLVEGIVQRVIGARLPV